MSIKLNEAISLADQIIKERKAQLKEHNKKLFADLKRVRDVGLYCSSGWYPTTKGEVRRMAKTDIIPYYFSDKVFQNRRTVMILK